MEQSWDALLSIYHVAMIIMGEQVPGWGVSHSGLERDFSDFNEAASASIQDMYHTGLVMISSLLVLFLKDMLSHMPGWLYSRK